MSLKIEGLSSAEIDWLNQNIPGEPSEAEVTETAQRPLDRMIQEPALRKEAEQTARRIVNRRRERKVRQSRETVYIFATKEYPNAKYPSYRQLRVFERDLETVREGLPPRFMSSGREGSGYR